MGAVAKQLAAANGIYQVASLTINIRYQINTEPKVLEAWGTIRTGTPNKSEAAAKFRRAWNLKVAILAERNITFEIDWEFKWSKPTFSKETVGSRCIWLTVVHRTR